MVFNSPKRQNQSQVNSSWEAHRSGASERGAMLAAAQKHGYGNMKIHDKTNHIVMSHSAGHELAIHSSGSWAHADGINKTLGEGAVKPVTGKGLTSLVAHLGKFHG